MGVTGLDDVVADGAVVVAGGVQVFVRRLGDRGRAPLVVIHGGPTWDHSYLMPAAGELTGVGEVVLFDLPGCGRSQRVRPGGDLDEAELQPDRMVEVVAALIGGLGRPVDVLRAVTADPAVLPAEAAAYVGAAARWFRAEGGYIAEQSTRPTTLAVALGDSPAGLAAWLVEKLVGWSDESAFTPDELLTWVSAYWVTGTIGTSFSTYTEPSVLPVRVETPAVVSVFPRDIKRAPRSWAEAFLSVREWVEHPAGGHFAAWEQPSAYVADLLRAVALGGR